MTSGLVMNPARLLPSVPEGLRVGLAMMLVARPQGVMVFQPWSPFTLRESLLLSWCGLRGAVPLALSFVVIALPFVCRRLDLTAPGEGCPVPLPS